MANNIKILGNILNTLVVSRYTEEDKILLSSKKLQENFGGKDDYIEYYIYDISGNLLNTDYRYLSYKLPSDIGLTPPPFPSNTTGDIQTNNVGITSTSLSNTSSLYPIIEIDPIKDLQTTGYSTGEFLVRYNFFSNKISNFSELSLFIKEISQDRTELRIVSLTLTNEEIEKLALSLIDKINNSDYYVDYLLNFGNNTQVIAVNVALNRNPDGYEILFKLYQPLPDSILNKTQLWVVEEKVSPYEFVINLDKLIIPPPPPTLRGPNFDISTDNTGTVATPYTNYQTLVSRLETLQKSSYQQILGLLVSQSADINIDYTDYSNFSFFGSVEQRLTNFYTKVKQIENYNNFIALRSPQTSSIPSLKTEINQFSSSINNIITEFDGYENYLYFESSSYAWPKSGSLKPFTLLSTGSTNVIRWYNANITSASLYDENNINNLIYSIPSYLLNDNNNQPFLTFLNMVGHYFDNIWIYLKSITDLNIANNNLEAGISKDLVYHQLISTGLKLYNSQAGENVDQFLIGANTGSSIWDNNTTFTGSYLNNVPRKDLVTELYKRIYHNLPYLLKTKGTVTGLKALMTVFGLYTNSRGNNIEEVKIGNQIWSSTNYQGTTYRDGTPILEAQSDTEWIAANVAGIGAWCYYSGSAEYAKFGKLYNGWAVKDPRGFAPQGWRIPTDADFLILTASAGGSTNAERARNLRITGSEYWEASSQIATNSTKFSAVGNGTRDFLTGSGPTDNTTWTNRGQRIKTGAGLSSVGVDNVYRVLIIQRGSLSQGTANMGLGQAVRFLKDDSFAYEDSDSGLLDIKEYGGSLKANLIKGYNNDKVRVIDNSITPSLLGNVLSPIMGLQTYPTASSQFRDSDSHFIDISFSPQSQIDTYISRSIASHNPTWSLDDYIGDPSQLYSTTYPDLDAQRRLYYQTGVTGFRPFTSSLLDYNRYIRLVEFFDNALFKMLADFVPERASLSTGITINSPVLERNKVAYANPTSTTTQSVYEANYEIASISSSYGTFYNTLSSSNNTMGWYDGELSGSLVDVNDYYEFENPYTKAYKLIPRVGIYRFTNNNNFDIGAAAIKGERYSAVNNTFRNATLANPIQLGNIPARDSRTHFFRNDIFPEVAGSGISITYEGIYIPQIPILSNDNEFLHSDYNILLNNVSQSIKSSFRNTIEYIRGDIRPTSSIRYPSELQDSYLSLQSYNNSRYTGTKLTSLKINTYTSSSYTGSDSITIVNGDNSYGKTAVIDRYTRKIGLFTQIENSPILPKRNNVALKYLVDEFGNLTELNQLNKNWEDVQRTFVLSGTSSVALFDAKQYGNQSLTNGDKPIFDSGYSYLPIFYYGTGSIDRKLYFDFLAAQSSVYVQSDVRVSTQNDNYRILGFSNPTQGPGVPNTGNTGFDYYVTASSPFPKAIGNLFQNVIQDEGAISPATTTFTKGSISNGSVTSPTFTAPIGGQYNIGVNLFIGLYSDGISLGTRTFKAELLQNNTVLGTVTRFIRYANPLFAGGIKIFARENAGFGINPQFADGTCGINSVLAGDGLCYGRPTTSTFTLTAIREINYPSRVLINDVSTTKVYEYVFPNTLPAGSPSDGYNSNIQGTGINFRGTTIYSQHAQLTFSNPTFRGPFTTSQGFRYFWIWDCDQDTAGGVFATSNDADVIPAGEQTLDMSLFSPTVLLSAGDTVTYKLTLEQNSNGDLNNNGVIAYIPQPTTQRPQQFVINIADASTGNYPFVTPTISSNPPRDYYISASQNILVLNRQLSNFYEGSTYLPTFQTGSNFFTGSLYSKFGDVNLPFKFQTGNIFIAVDQNGRYFESRIKTISNTSNGLKQIELYDSMSTRLSDQINENLMLEVLFLGNEKDETNVVLTFSKKPGQTSYGFLIPETLAPDVLENIDTITKQVKQKLLSNSQNITQ
jgi:uncharacterized protein (TIGR02145 family)